MNQVESKNVIINLKQANIEMQNKSLKNKSPLNSSLNEFFMTQEEKKRNKQPSVIQERYKNSDLGDLIPKYKKK